jgi:hypothetical protein
MRTRTIARAFTLLSLCAAGCAAPVGAGEPAATSPDAPVDVEAPSAAAPDAGAGALAADAAPAPTDTPSSTSGGLHVELTQVPATVQCVAFLVSGSINSQFVFAAAPGTSSTGYALTPLFPGTYNVGAFGYNTSNCTPTTPQSYSPIYQSVATTITVLAGVPASINVALYPISNGIGTINFETPAVSIAASTSNTYAVLSDGTIRAWGDNTYQQLGYAGAGSPLPVKVPNVSNAVQVSAGNGFACALLASNQVECWGANNAGQIGTGATSSTPSAPAFVPGLYATEIRSNGTETCARGMNGPKAAGACGRSPS